MYDKLTTQLIRDEGEVLHAYTDSLGYLTIGVGRLIDERKGGGITETESRYLLANDVARKANQLFSALPWAEHLDDARQGVLLNMAFNMGINGLMQFRNTLAMIQAGKWDDAAAGMLDSKWARQVGPRATRLAEQMRTGVWQ